MFVEQQDKNEKNEKNEKEEYCALYHGWECFLATVVIGLIVICLLIGFGGPWYHDCGHDDCSTLINYGLYCEDYCWHGHAGPGSTLLLFTFGGILLALAIPYCYPYTGRHRRIRYDDNDYRYGWGGGSINIY